MSNCSLLVDAFRQSRFVVWVRRMCMWSTMLVTPMLRFSSVYAAVEHVHGCAEAHLPTAEGK
jgi:hypothetical protein